MRTAQVRSLSVCAFLLLALSPAAAQDAKSFESWPLLTAEFPSTGGGGFVIRGYDPVVKDGRCTTDFTAHDPAGPVYRNEVVFDAKPVAGGILCTNGRWRAKDGSSSGTTPLEVFIKDGIRRRSP